MPSIMRRCFIRVNIVYIIMNMNAGERELCVLILVFREVTEHTIEQRKDQTE